VKIKLSPKKDVRAIEILLVEDNPGDIRLTKEAFIESNLSNILHVARDGIEAMDILRGAGKYKEPLNPDLIILDLNLPRKDGREVLAELKVDNVLKRIPIVILTTSSAEEDIMKTYQLHANCYITKPVDMEQFIKVVQCIEDFWFSIVKLPNRRRKHRMIQKW